MNSERSNKHYDDSNPADGGFRDPGHAEALDATADADSWEPPDEVKGDLARSMFYMDVRYNGDRTNEPDLVLTDRLSDISTSAAFMGRLSTLLLWHFEDPVDAREQARNDGIHTLYQFNRNPFVDRPEWVAAVFLNVLRIEVEANQVKLSWPDVYSDAVLESAADPGGAWAPVTQTVARTNGRLQVTAGTGSGSTFYRLRFP